MRTVLGVKDVSFRSETQRKALRAIVSKGDLTPLVVVLPTGGEKSMLFMAPACLNDPGVTVVVVPYLALLDNLLSKAKKAGDRLREWKGREVNQAALVFVSADNVDLFMNYARLLEEKGLLRRVFVDESHLTCTSTSLAAEAHDWLRVPTFVLTATLPIVLEFELKARMAAQMARYIRMVTTRSKTRYIVDMCPAGTGLERTMELCRLIKEHLTMQKGVVYSRSRKQFEQLAEKLQCAYYHAGAVDNQERLDGWLAVRSDRLCTGVGASRASR
ncbi:hypothetical protein LTS02_010787 [Friedmanniomyces endolithicus]|nr:hypothetical protein LTS02_010787 [Friedmanniomyces endolithicus]